MKLTKRQSDSLVKFSIIFFGLLCIFLPAFRFISVFLKRQYIAGTHTYASKLDSVYSGTSDFIYFWGTGKFINAGHIHDIINFNQMGSFIAKLCGHVLPYGNWAYWPTYNFIICFLALFPLLIAFAIWNIFTASLGYFAFSKIIKQKWLILMLVFSPVALVNYHYGQTGMFLSSLLILGFAYWKEEQERNILSWDTNVKSGVFFGLCSLKFPFIILIPIFLLVTKSWKTLLYMMFTMFFMVIASFVCFGIQPWIDNIEILSPLISKNILKPYNNQMFQELYISPFIAMRSFHFSLTASWCFQLLVTLSCIIAVAFVFFKKILFTKRDIIGFILPLSLLATPYGHVYDLVIASLTIIICFQKAYEKNKILFYPILGFFWYIWGACEYSILTHAKIAPYLPSVNSIILFILVIILYILRDTKDEKNAN
jgi:hypothetical protein